MSVKPLNTQTKPPDIKPVHEREPAASGSICFTCRIACRSAQTDWRQIKTSDFFLLADDTYCLDIITQACTRPSIYTYIHKPLGICASEHVTVCGSTDPPTRADGQESMRHVCVAAATCANITALVYVQYKLVHTVLHTHTHILARCLGHVMPIKCRN